MGTDALGRDVFTRILYGGRASLGISVASVGLAVVVASAVGLISGAVGGWFDALVQRVVDMLMAFPGLIIVISLTAFLGTSILLLIVVIAIALLGGGIRISRAAAIQVSSQPYIEAARLDRGDHAQSDRAPLCQCAAADLVIATAYLGIAILIEASVSFLGYGIQPPAASWGFMLGAEARIHMIEQPWLSVWPGLAIFPQRLQLQHHRRRPPRRLRPPPPRRLSDGIPEDYGSCASSSVMAVINGSGRVCDRV